MPSRSDLPAAGAVVTLSLLLRIKLRAMLNRLSQAIQEAPVKFLATAGAMAAVWLGLYVLFECIFMYLKQSPLEAAVAIPMVFSFFFVAMLLMLAISNAILAYMGLFATEEAGYLLTAPVPPRAYVALKYLETLLFSSWSLILLGLPLMAAMADISDEPWYYYPFFVAFFICFVPIPGAIGLVIAWALARYLNRGLIKKLMWGALLLAAVVVVAVVQSVEVNEEEPGQWLSQFLLHVSFVQSALLPSSWVTKGVEAAMEYRTSDALGYLAVTVANALFLSLVAVYVVSTRFSAAFDRALSTRGGERRRSSHPSGGVCGLAFWYLPRSLRLIAAKDLRTFFRDPLQWTQLVILFGLMALYLVNVPRFANGIAPLDGWGMIIPYLNFGAISFILATFTSRFVFPLISLEGRQMWLIGMLPLRTSRVLIAKFAFAMTVSVSVAVSTTALAAAMLQMPLPWACVQIAVMFAVCTGLCGLAVGVGARLPMFEQRNAARIANGFGGTVNLIASVLLVLVMLAGMSYIGVRNRNSGFAAPVDPTTLMIAAAVAGIGCLTGAFALWLGGRHFRRVEI